MSSFITDSGIICNSKYWENTILFPISFKVKVLTSKQYDIRNEEKQYKRKIIAIKW